MKKKQWKKSELSAKERKELRREPKPEPKAAAKRPSVAIWVAVGLAALAIFAGIFIPTFMFCNYMFEKNPVAVIRLNIGGEAYDLKYELFYEECPIAVTDFAYLASVGFFDGTVVYDAQNSRVRFGGYTQKTNETGKVSLVHRSADEAFTSARANDFRPAHYEGGSHAAIFRYSLKEDETGMKETDLPFSLNANKPSSAGGATEFQIFGNVDVGNNPDELVSGTTRRIYQVYPIGRPLEGDDGAARAVEAIFALGLAEETYNAYFRPPASKTVTVESVKIYNFGEYEAWRQNKYEYAFEDYMEEKFGSDSSSVFRSWAKNPI